MKRVLALFLILVLTLSMLPAVFAAPDSVDDLWETILRIEDGSIKTRRAVTESETAQAFASVTDKVVSAVLSSDVYEPGSLEYHGSIVFWRTVDGMACGYSADQRAKLRSTAITEGDPEDYCGTAQKTFAKRSGSPGSKVVTVFQPYYGLDSSFSAQYVKEGEAIAAALGGTCKVYRTNDATIDALASALEESAVVVLDSHGDTDYKNPKDLDDYYSEANTSYLCFQNGTGFTPEDMQQAEGPFGTYYHAFYGGTSPGGRMKYYYADGTAIANHMSTDAPHSLVWSALCLGMATDGLCTPLRQHGVEVVYGYSQSVTFDADYDWEKVFWSDMIRKETVASSIMHMKTKYGIKDPYENKYPAYPIVVSSEDAYPGHGNVDAAQTVYSSWMLLPKYEITAVSNDTALGSVTLNGPTITAAAKEGCFVAGYEVISGSASIRQNGDEFYVSPLSDCVIRIQFEKRLPAQLFFDVPEGLTCEPISSFVGLEVTMPIPIGVFSSDYRSYTFCGWTSSQVPDAATKPADLIAPGEPYMIRSETDTLYAVYSYDIGSNAGKRYTLLRAAPDQWDGAYVITYQGTVLLDGGANAGQSEAWQSGASCPISDTSVFISGNTLVDVDDRYVFLIQSSNTDGAYTVRMKQSNKFLSFSSGSFDIQAVNTPAAQDSLWMLSYASDGVQISSKAAENYYIQYNSISKIFRCYPMNQSLKLYKEEPRQQRYTTQPLTAAVCQTHTFGEWDALIAADCLHGGVEKHTCLVCGTIEHRATTALGHLEETDPEVLPTCIQTGLSAGSHCGRCGILLQAQTVLKAKGHNWSVFDVLQTASASEPGIASRTCSVCGQTQTQLIPVAGSMTCPGADACPGSVFSDMPAMGTWAHDPIDWAVINRITNGTSADTFEPDAPCTRGQIVTFLWRFAGSPEPDTDMNPFEDVASEDYFYFPVLWAVGQGITKGTGERTFEPDAPCTRGQIVTFLWRYSGYPASEDASLSFTDVERDAYYHDPVVWAVRKEITNGTGDAVFEPETTCTRAQAVTFLQRAAKLSVYTE